MKGYFRVDGLEAYLEKLNAAGQNVDAAADRAVAAGGEVVFQTMLDRVPVDTGKLKAHLTETGRTPVQRQGNLHFMEIGLLDLGATGANYGGLRKGSKRKGSTRRGTHVYPREFLYGIIVEYGSSSMAAEPYVRPAFDNNHAKVKQAEIDALKESGVL